MPPALLAGLDAVDWAALRHAYGSAEDVPRALRDAAADDARRAAEALDHLCHSVYHQGTLYSATPHTVPFLARLATEPTAPHRRTWTLLLTAVAAADDAPPRRTGCCRCWTTPTTRSGTPPPACSATCPPTARPPSWPHYGNAAGSRPRPRRSQASPRPSDGSPQRAAAPG